MVQWLRICLPMQETQVPHLVQEDSTCCRAIKPVHNLLKSACPEPKLCNKRSHLNEKPTHHN